MKFSIRDLFLVTVIVAMGLGWWVDRSRLAEREQEVIQDVLWLSVMANGEPRNGRPELEQQLIDKYGDLPMSMSTLRQPKTFPILPDSQAPAPHPKP